MILKVSGIIIFSILIAIVLKDVNKNISLLVTIVSVTLVFIFVFKDYADVINEVFSLAQYNGIKRGYISLILKVVGIGYLCEFTASIANDADLKSIGACIEFSGKVFIAIISMPLFKDLIGMITGLLP